MKNWKDITSYKYNEKEKTPRIWELQTEYLRITVHRYLNYTAEWLLKEIKG